MEQWVPHRQCLSVCPYRRLLLICHFIYKCGVRFLCRIYDDQCCFNNGTKTIIIIYRSVSAPRKEEERKRILPRNTSGTVPPRPHVLFCAYTAQSYKPAAAFMPPCPAEHLHVHGQFRQSCGLRERSPKSTEGESIHLEFCPCRIFLSSFTVFR